MKFKPLACGHHSHTDMSLDGASTVETKILYADKIGRIADVVTDHGVMSGLLPHHMAAQKLFKDKKTSKPIQSIHGIEAYVIDWNRTPKIQKNGKVVPFYYHMTIHFKTKEAYEYFCRLTPLMEERAIVKWNERKPLLKIEELEPISGQIIISSGCLIGPVLKNIMEGRSDWATENYHKLRNLAGPGNFFVEVFPHIIKKTWMRPVKDKQTKKVIQPGYFANNTTVRRHENAIDPEPCLIDGAIDLLKAPNEFIIRMATCHKDPIVMSLDDHYATEKDELVQIVRLGNGEENWRFSNSHHMMVSDEAAANIQQQMPFVQDKQIEEWIDNSYLFVDKFKDYKVTTSKERGLLPTTEMVYGVKTPSIDILPDLIKKHNRMPDESSPLYKIYKERLDYEVSVLHDNGILDFLPYFFVIEDVSDHCKKNGIANNARGSAGGSLLAFLLGISVTDPIKYDLPFERFLTKGRIASGSYPDIDKDFEDREAILVYMKEKYGDKLALISTDLMMRLKTSILDVERSELGSVSENTAKMCKALKGAQQGQSDKEWLFGYTDKDTGGHVQGFWDTPESADLRKYAEDWPERWDTILRCIGITKTRGVHAGGIIITPDSVANFMPMIRTNKGLATANSMKAVEHIGGIKYDFLGVSTLKALSVTMKSIKKELGVDLEWGEFPHDENVYKEVIAKDRLAGIFQLNTSTVRPYVQKIKPKSIRDISALTALIRPGSLDAPAPNPDFSGTAADYYVACAQGAERPYYIHDDLIPIIGETFGIFVFQEQPLKVFRDLVGYTYETAEGVRRSIGKKDKKELEFHLGILKEKLLERGWAAEQADILAETIIKSARYSFNMSHSVSYGIVAYNGCYLKHHYPLHFWKGELEVNGDDHDTIREYLKECGKLILPISFEKSHPSKWMIEGDFLRPPLNLLRGCGEVTVRNLKSFYEKPIKDLVVENLIEKEDNEQHQDME